MTHADCELERGVVACDSALHSRFLLRPARARKRCLTLVTTAGAFGGVECFMRRLGCDVLCLQETKASRALLQVSGCIACVLCVL